MTTVVRLKYRAAPVQPKDKGTPGHSLSCGNKKKFVPPPVVEADARHANYDKIFYHIPHTQSQRKETVVRSEETEYRRTNQPSYHEKVKEHTKYMNQKLKHERMTQLLQEAKVKFEEDKKNSAAVSEENLGKIGDMVVEMAKRRTEIQKQMELEEAEMEEFDDEAFQIEALNMKEKKLMYVRQPHGFHKAMKKWSRRFLAFRVAMGLYYEPNVKLRSMLTGHYKVIDHSISEILPWLHIGKVETAQNEEFLIKHKFTHILNVTDSHPNFFPNSFVYMKIPIDDSETVDCSKYFDQVADFIKRVEDVKGKLFVHCVSGVSRAPTMVMAWLIRKKQITLWDAYNYVMARRSLVYPNNNFRYQLALYEMKLGFGSSVKNKNEFASYEFNLLKVRTLIFLRRSKGLLETTLMLYHKPKFVSNINI